MTQEGLLGLLKEIDDQGLNPDNEIYTSMIDANGKAGKLREAFGLWDTMIGAYCAFQML